MKYTVPAIVLVVSISYGAAGQTDTYEISFKNAVHHEAVIRATFPDLHSDTVSLRMSRTSPGRYALHEFAKNIYNLKATDSKGKSVNVIRSNHYQWEVTGHDGTVHVSYTLFANRCDGTYSQIDETHAHLNIPATFIYAPALSNRKIEIDIKVREDLDWKVATQMPKISGTTYSAPNLSYFMDSPIEISNFSLREFEVESNGTKYNIQFVLHHNCTEAEFDAYFEKVRKAILETKAIYGEFPDFDYGRYTFLACYIPNAVGDGMEHRNSTILTTRQGLSDNSEGKLVTVAHELFHAWNVERIRPRSLEPFSFEEVNMSGELWFAEGVTTYFTDLILCRAGITTPERFVENIMGDFNYVWTSPGHQFFSPVEMSYQAPFADGAVSMDPKNEVNTFVDYYLYGSTLGLALDLSLRQRNLNLDDFMKLIWQAHGKREIPCANQDLHNMLCQYAGKAFGDEFFNRFIYESGMPDYELLFQSVGIGLERYPEIPYFGADVSINDDGTAEIQKNTRIGSPAYKAGLDKGDIIISINDHPLTKGRSFTAAIEQFKAGDTLKITFEQLGRTKTTAAALESSPRYFNLPGGKVGAQTLRESREKAKRMA